MKMKMEGSKNADDDLEKSSNLEIIEKEGPQLSELELMSDEEFYSRFSSKRKTLIVFIVSLSCFLSPLSSMSFLPAVSIIAARFNTTGTIINVSNAVYCIVMAISPCLIGPFGSIYGKRFTFVLCLALFVIASILTALSQNLAMFFVFRAMSALFGTPFFSVGSSTIGDIYDRTSRGTAMGWVLSGSQVGPALGPVIGGIVVTYTTWRVIFWIQVGLGSTALIMAIFFLPETSRITELAKKKRELRFENKSDKIYFIPYNPTRVVVYIFKYPNLLLAAIVAMGLHFNMYSLLTPIRYVVDPRFNLTEPIYGGLFYLAPGAGYITGSFFGGRYADHYVKKYLVKRGRHIFEDRLYSMLFCYALVIPGTILIYGWCLEKEKGGMAVPIIMMFLGGFGQTICFPSINTYCVECMPQLKGDAIAGNYVVRFLAAAIGTAFVLEEITAIGIGWTCTISAGFLYCGLISCLLLIRFGEKLRLNGWSYVFNRS